MRPPLSARCRAAARTAPRSCRCPPESKTAPPPAGGAVEAAREGSNRYRPRDHLSLSGDAVPGDQDGGSLAGNDSSDASSIFFCALSRGDSFGPALSFGFSPVFFSPVFCGTIATLQSKDVPPEHRPRPVRSSGSAIRSEEHTYELQSLMRISYVDYC